MLIRAFVVAAIIFASQRPVEEPAITGDVLGPDGKAVAGGSVALTTIGPNKNIAAIDRNGHFRIISDSQGERSLYISVPRFAPYRAIVSVPSSRRMNLPAITLSEPTYYQARFVTVDGDPIASGLRRQSVDADGAPIDDPLDHTRERFETDGTVIVGPLAPGRTRLGFDRAPLAPTRLNDFAFSSPQGVKHWGTITIQPATQMRVDVLDGNGRPVPQHDVSIEDAVQPSPLSYQAVKTDARGRAVFERLGRGRYRISTSVVERCGTVPLTVSRLASATDSAAPAVRLVAGGSAALRVMTPLGPLLSRSVRVTPDQPQSAPAIPRRFSINFTPPSCVGMTDSEGRVRFASFPPGPAQVRVELFNSSYIARVTVPDRETEITVAIPDGLIPVRVIDRATQRPIANALTVWTGGGGRVEAFTTANGDALLEAAGAAGGTLTISDREYQTLEGVFDVTPDTLQEVALTRLPPSRPQVMVITEDNQPVRDAVIELTGGGDITRFASTDAKGIAFFSDIGRGTLRLIAHADGFVSTTMQIPEDARASIRSVVKTR
jgi:hypothetical protein